MGKIDPEWLTLRNILIEQLECKNKGKISELLNKTSKSVVE